MSRAPYPSSTTKNCRTSRLVAKGKGKTGFSQILAPRQQNCNTVLNFGTTSIQGGGFRLLSPRFDFWEWLRGMDFLKQKEKRRLQILAFDKLLIHNE